LGKVSIAMLPSEETVFARGDLAWVRAILRKSSRRIKIRLGALLVFALYRIRL
jgi:hypothetical protein